MTTTVTEPARVLCPSERGEDGTMPSSTSTSAEQSMTYSVATDRSHSAMSPRGGARGYRC